MPAVVQRNAMSAFRHRFTLRQTRRTVPIMFSMLLVQASERRSCVGRPRRLTVSISSSHFHSIRINAQWPFAPVTLGEMLKEEFLTEYGLSQNQLAKAIGISPNRTAEIVNNRRRITADTALRLSLYFGNSPEFALMRVVVWSRHRLQIGTRLAILHFTL